MAQRDRGRVPTTHAGSLPFLPGVADTSVDDDARLRDAVERIVRHQRELGLDTGPIASCGPRP